MKILFIEHCNYIDSPTGGQLNFARNMLSAFGSELSLVGSDSKKSLTVGQWATTEIDGKRFDFFTLDYLKRQDNTKPLLPARISSFFKIKRFIAKILTHDFSYILLQAPEALFAIPKKYRKKVIFCSPGVANPIVNSRYAYARWLSHFYDLFFFHYVKDCSLILAAASYEEITEFKKRALNVGHEIDVIQFPTRYDESIFFEQPKEDSRKSLGIDPDCVIYTAVGRLNWHKGWKFMIDSFLIVLKKFENARLYFIGDGEDSQAIRAYIRKIKLEGKVVLCGRLTPTSIALHLNASDVYISASYKEGWSTTLVEACSCNVPCVVTNFSSSQDMIENGVNGFILENRSEEQFAQRMMMAIEMNRERIKAHNSRFSNLAVSKLKEELSNIILDYAK